MLDTPLSSLFASTSRSVFRETCKLPVRILLQLMNSRLSCSRKTHYASSGLCTLPNEILVKIFGFCEDNDLAHLRLQNRRFNQLILACPPSLLTRHQQRLVTCLTISYVQDDDCFLLATFKKSHSSRKNCITIPRKDVLNGRGQNLKFCFRRFRILGLQLSNLPLCSTSLDYFCELLGCCPALEPKTLRVCDCYVAELQRDSLARLMRLCAAHLIVLSFINLTGVRETLFSDALFTSGGYAGLYVLMLQAVEFHFSVPQCRQQLAIGDATLAALPSAIRKVKLEKCADITADGVCSFVERYFGSEPSTSAPHRSGELLFKQCDRLTTSSFEASAQKRSIPVEGQEEGDYIMNWVKRRQYHIRRGNERRLLSIEIDSYRPTRSGLASPATGEDLSSRVSLHSLPCIPSTPCPRELPAGKQRPVAPSERLERTPSSAGVPTVASPQVTFAAYPTVRTANIVKRELAASRHVNQRKSLPVHSRDALRLNRVS